MQHSRRTRRRASVSWCAGFVASFHLPDFPLSSALDNEVVEERGRRHFKGIQFEKDIILWGVRWYVAYPISYRQLEEIMGERGVAVDQSTLNRWVIRYAPEVEKQFRRCQRPVGRSCRPTCIAQWTQKVTRSTFC